MLTSFEIIQNQRKERNLLQQEIEAEERYLHVLSLSYYKTCRSKIGRDNSKSIAQQLNYWIDSLTDEQKKNKLLMVELDNSLDEFRKYIFIKYENNLNQRNKFESLFIDQDYVNDVKRILIHKIYDYKLDQSLRNFENGFASPRAHSICALNQQKKEIRSAAHEGMASAYKKLNGPILPESIENMMYQTFERVIDQRIDKFFKGSNRYLGSGEKKLLI